MNSRLDSIFRTTFRPAEQTDTWLGIKREEPQHDQKKKQRNQGDDPGSFGDDDASLSLQALHNFLKTLITPSSVTTPTEPIAIPPDSPTPPHPANPQAMAAAQAYQSTARHGPGSVLLQDTPPPVPTEIAPTLSAEEQRIIYKLLHDIDVLAARGIATIPLLPAENFLGSLVAGVAAKLAEPR